jgi:hypothetical protein
MMLPKASCMAEPISLIGGGALPEILDCQPPRGRISAIDLAVGPDVLLAEPLKSGKRSSLSRSRRKSHDCGLAAKGFRLKGEL